MTQINPNDPLDPFLLNLYKPPGPTSFDIIRQLKRLYPGKKLKIGHFGTLDPFAEGIVLVGVHGATRVQPYLEQSDDKEYMAVGKFGEHRDSLDREGTILQKGKLLTPCPELAAVNELLKSKFCGDIMQKVPYFSATKHEGKPLYEWARQGVMIEKEPVKRTIYSIEARDLCSEFLKFEVKVSKGTYIRQLFVDISERLGTLGHLDRLIRHKVGSFASENSVQLAELKCWQDVLDRAICPSELVDLPEFSISKAAKTRFLQGQSIEQDCDCDSNLAWFFHDGRLLGIGRNENHRFFPKLVWQRP